MNTPYPKWQGQKDSNSRHAVLEGMLKRRRRAEVERLSEDAGLGKARRTSD